MTDSPIGIAFWILAIWSVVCAVGTVTIKKAAHAVAAFAVANLAVAGILAYLRFIVLGLTYMIIMSGSALTVYLAVRKANANSSDAIKLELFPRTGVYFIAALLVFTGTLFLIAHTEVWQYAVDVQNFTFPKLLETVKTKYLLPFFFSLAMLFALSVIVSYGIKQKDN